VEFTSFGDLTIDLSADTLTFSRTGGGGLGGLNFLYPEGGPYKNGFRFTIGPGSVGSLTAVTETSRQGQLRSSLDFTPSASFSGNVLFVNLAGVSFNNPHASISYGIESDIQPIPLPAPVGMMALAFGMLGLLTLVSRARPKTSA
jgi:hypothetical protein